MGRGQQSAHRRGRVIAASLSADRYRNTGTNTTVVCTLNPGRCVATVDATQTNVKHADVKVGSCPASPSGSRHGWRFVTPDISSLFVSINCQFEKAGNVTKMVQTKSTQECFVFTPTQDTLISATAVIDGKAETFNLDYVCSLS